MRIDVSCFVDNADRHIGEEIARDGTMPKRIERDFIGVERSAYHQSPE
jgi:hypothetical protein